MNDLEDRILAHIGLYQVSFASVIERRFFDGEPCGQVMNRLATQRRIRIRKGLPGLTPKYYQLTRTELRQRGLPECRSRRPKQSAFQVAVSVLWYCNMLDTQRHLLESHEVSRMFPAGLPRAIHCVGRSDNAHCIHRVRQVAPQTSVDQLQRKLRTRVSRTILRPGLRPWITTGRYRFILLSESNQQTERLSEAIADDPYLSETGRIDVEHVPALTLLAAAASVRSAADAAV